MGSKIFEAFIPDTVYSLQGTAVFLGTNYALNLMLIFTFDIFLLWVLFQLEYDRILCFTFMVRIIFCSAEDTPLENHSFHTHCHQSTVLGPQTPDHSHLTTVRGVSCVWIPILSPVPRMSKLVAWEYI